MSMVGFSEADWEGNSNDRKGPTGGFFLRRM